MIFNYKQHRSTFDGFNIIEFDLYTCYCQGVFFLRGYKAGEESVNIMIEKYQQNKNFEFDKFYGAFLMIIYDKNDEEYIFFSDNSSLRSFYMGETAISDSFLKLVEAEKEVSLNAENMCKYVSLGYVPFEETVINEINISNRESYYKVKNSTVMRFEKGIGKIYDQGSFDSVENFFKDISYALQDENISFDITGGFDSRLVLCEMYKYLPEAEVSVSGPSNNPDIIVGKQVAEAMGKKVDHFSPDITEVDDENILGLIQYTQFAESFVKFFREWKLAIYRKKKDIKIRITGDGGVLHKDWFWIQDFPFYNKKIRNTKKFLGKYYETRAKIVNSTMDFFDKRITQHLAEQKQKFIEKCMPYCTMINTETYDMLSYYVSATHHYCRYNLQAPYVNNYAPLMEYEYVKYAYHLPRKDRFFNNYMRKCIDKCNHSVAKIRTIYGTRATGSLISRIVDIPFYFIGQLKRIKVLFTRMVNNKNPDFGVEEWNPEEFIRSSSLLEEAHKYCTRIGMLASGCEKEKLDMNAIEVILSVYNLKLVRKKDIYFK